MTTTPNVTFAEVLTLNVAAPCCDAPCCDEAGCTTETGCVCPPGCC